MLLLLSNHHRRRSRMPRLTCVIDGLSALVLWGGALWLSTGLAIFVLVPAASPALSAPPPAAQQAQPPASQASPAKPGAPQAAHVGPPAPQASQAKQAPPQASQAQPPAGTPAPAGPPAPQPSQPEPAPSTPLQTPPAGQTAPPTQTPPATPPAVAGGPGVGFRLDNADLLQFINLVASELKLNYIVDAAVKGAVTISTSGELKPEDLLPILESVLKMNGATAIKTGNFYRFVPLAAAPKNLLGLSTSSNTAELPTDDRMLMQIIPLKFIFAADVGKMLTPFLSEGGTATALDAGNTLILVDDSLNVKRLMEIIQQFDNTSFAAQRVRLLPVHNNMASALVPELEAIFSTYALSDKQTPLRFLPLDRINGILVAAADPAAFAEVEQWIGKLDQPATPNGIQTFVYKVQYSEAGRLVRLLNALRGLGGETTGETGTGTSGRGRVGGRGGAGGTSLQEEVSQQGSNEITASAGLFSPGGGKGSGTANEPTLRIITDPVSNSVIVQGTAQEYADIAKTLDKLDVVPRQVQIEARVYEVDLTGALSLGLEYALQQRGTGTTPLQFLGGYAKSALTGSTGTVVGSRQLMAFLTATENRSRVRTLSAPTLLTTDSTEARIQVGISVPMLTSQALVAGAQSGSNSLFTNTINNQDTGIMLSVTPRITSTGLVSLRINQEVSAAQPNSSSTIQSPSISKRTVTTQAVAQDGQTIALGGMISYTNTKTINRIPLLGDIPWLGVLFGSTSYTSQETELIVLLTPHIISTLPAAAAATRELEDRLKDLRREFKKDALLKP
jgi:general secretion pathway protein D